MFNRFDVSAKELIWDDPLSWIEGLGIASGRPVEVIESDITTLSASADKVIRVGDSEPFLVNIELQSSHDADLLPTTWFRQVALDYRHKLPVLTVLVLLRKEANSPSLTGVYERWLPEGRLVNRYEYQVVRLWQEDVEPFLTAGIGLVPLAPLANVRDNELPEVVRRMAERINPLPVQRASILWTATFILMGLKYSEEFTAQLLEGVQTMQESVTYQKILNDGREEARRQAFEQAFQEGLREGALRQARRNVLRHGTRRFASPNPSHVATLEAIQDFERFDAIYDRILDIDVQDWNGLLSSS
jgi:predicted transposase YdaD